MRTQLILLLGFLILLFSLGACAQTDEHAGHQPTTEAPAKASAQLAPTEGSSVTGTVTFEQNNAQVHVSAMVSGLTPGKHGFHIHEIGDCSAPDATSAGGHFNPGGVDHGAPDAEVHHVGDLGNLEANAEGTAEYHANWGFLRLDDSDDSIVGKAVIVHSGEDDFATQPTGNAGARLACGVITLE